MNPYKSKVRSVVVVISALLLTGFLATIAVFVGLVAPLGRTMQAIERFWGRQLMKMVAARVTVTGAENILPEKTYIFISNHQSLFDIPLMMAFAPKQLRMIFKKELLYIPGFGFILWWLKFVAIDRGNREKAIRSLHEAAEKIQGGVNIVIYADGTRSLDGQLRPFKKGAFILAIDAQVDVVPVTISGTIRILHKLQGMTDITFGQAVHLHFGLPIATRGMSLEEKDRLKEDVTTAISDTFETVKQHSVIDDHVLMKRVENYLTERG